VGNIETLASLISITYDFDAMPDRLHIETERLLLRAWRPEDREPFAALNADPEVMRWFPAPMTRAESDTLADRIEARMAELGFGLTALEIKGGPRFAGFVGLSVPGYDLPCQPCVEIGWRLARAAWGQGYATEAATAWLDHAFGPLGLSEVVSFTALGNARSRRVMERLGMSRNPAEDFEHPALASDHPLCRHVLYRLPAAAWSNAG